MYYCNNYALAVLFCVVTMFCWGSWGNTQKLAGKTWRYELFYWDYVIGVVLFALWGILVWREFKGVPKKAAILNVSMFVLFLVGLGLIIAAGEK